MWFFIGVFLPSKCQPHPTDMELQVFCLIQFKSCSIINHVVIVIKGCKFNVTCCQNNYILFVFSCCLAKSGHIPFHTPIDMTIPGCCVIFPLVTILSPGLYIVPKLQQTKYSTLGSYFSIFGRYLLSCNPSQHFIDPSLGYNGKTTIVKPVLGCSPNVPWSWFDSTGKSPL